MCLISCTNTVREDSPCHPRLLLAVTRKRAAGSTNICEMNPPWWPGIILNCTPLFILPEASGSPASATFQSRMLSFDAQARCRPSGNATTHDTTPELRGLRSVLRILGVCEDVRPVCRTSKISTVPFRLPAYIWPPSADQHAETHQGGVFSLIQSRPTPVPGE